MDMKYFLSIASVVLTLTILILLSCGRTPEEPKVSQYRAAIIDQLYLLESNPSFLAEATAILETYGFRLAYGGVRRLP